MVNFMSESRKPNIVLILNDDMGFSDLGCYGGEVHTPNLDRLAFGGLRFTQFYNTARCCPSRASLLTGLHPHQTGVGHMTSDDGLEGYRGDLNDRCITIADAVRSEGYGTYMCGKWHLTRHIGADDPKHSWPCQRGFDNFFGTIRGATNYWKPFALTQDNTRLDSDNLPDGFFNTDAISSEAITFVKDHSEKKPDNPFFLYLAYSAPHWPLHAHEEDIAKYCGRFAAGWDELREERLSRMREMKILDKSWGLTDRDSSQRPWTEAEYKEWNQRRMEVYAAQITRMDAGIGELIKTLEEIGQLGNTLILFLSDNGACAEELGGPPKKRDREKLISTQTTSDGKPVYRGNDPSIMPGPETSYQSYGVPWANLSNTPFRLYKHWVHEGGISTPLIVHWPDVVKAAGELRHQIGQLPDIMATCLEVSGATYPEEHDGKPILPLEGTSLVPIFENKQNGKEILFWEHEGNCAIRQGDCKLVSRFPGNWELYDMQEERTEIKNIAKRHPQKVRELEGLYQDWSNRCFIYPWDKLKEHRRLSRQQR